MTGDNMARWRAERPESAARFDALEAKFKADTRRELWASLIGGLIGLVLTVSLGLLFPAVAGPGIGVGSVLVCVLLANVITDWWRVES